MPSEPVRLGRTPRPLGELQRALEVALGTDGLALTVSTSGSTGRPREVALSAAALRSAADASAERLGGHGGWLLALPVEHIAGAQVVVRSIIAGRAPATLPPGATFTAAAFAAAAATLAAPRRYTSLVPTQLHRLVTAEPDVPVVWPLTGVATTELVERPALAIKIENPREGRPQTGLEAADMVWEEVVEGGVTRYVAVYHSSIPADVGPIRSVRPMDPAIAAPLKGLIAFSGGQAPFVAAVRAAGLQVLAQDAGNAGFYRSKDRAAPHNVHATMSTLFNQADANHKASPPAQFSFAWTAALATAAVSGTPATNLNITMSGYSNPVWSWDAADGAWLRSEGSAPAVAASGARLAAQNVLILSVVMVNTQYLDPIGTPVPETKLVGSGTGLLATGGKTIPVNWSKASVDAPISLSAGGGNALLAPGKTWIQLVPNSSGSFSVS